MQVVSSSSGSYIDSTWFGNKNNSSRLTSSYKMRMISAIDFKHLSVWLHLLFFLFLFYKNKIDIYRVCRFYFAFFLNWDLRNFTVLILMHLLKVWIHVKMIYFYGLHCPPFRYLIVCHLSDIVWVDFSICQL